MGESQVKLMTKLIELLEETRREIEPLPWEAWMHDFLRDLERHQGLVSAAIDLSVKSRDTIYKVRKRNQEFARRWDAVVKEGARERARARRRRRTEESES